VRLLPPFLVLLAALLIAAALGGRPSGGALVIVQASDVFTLDPQRQSYLRDFRVGLALYEGLVRCEDEAVVPAVAAEPPERSGDGRCYRFRLRPEARWSNGHAVTAHDFVYSWWRLLLPDTAADYSHLLFAIEGAREFWESRARELASFASGAGPDPTARRAEAERLWREGFDRFQRTVGVRAVDDHTLEVVLHRPVPYFLDLLAFAVCCPVYRPCVEGWTVSPGDEPRLRERGWIALRPPPLEQCRWLSVDADGGRIEQRHQWARPGVLVGNGPYTLAAWRYKRDLRLERNPFYHAPGAVRSPSILMLTIEDANTRVLAFESGRVDWLTDVAAEYQADMLEERRAYLARHAADLAGARRGGAALDEALARLPEPGPGERRDIHALASFGTDFFNFNCRALLADGRPNPFADRRVRRAFARAVDREAIVRHVTRLDEPVLTTLIPPGCIAGYPSPAGLASDPAEAAAELAAAGWTDRDGDGLVEDARGRPFPAVDLLYTTNTPRYRWMALALKSQWEERLGVRVLLRGTDAKFYKEDLRHGRFMIARGRWYGDYGDPTTFLDICRAGDGNNDRGYADPRYDAMLERADLEPDAALRLERLAECERVLVQEEVPLVPICQIVELTMYEPGALRGLSHHPRLVQHLFKLEARR
jgi:oligopeptide transport system substrate-binding protein